MTVDQLKVTSQHLARKAVVYLRQSSPKQVHENLQSQRLQYALRDKARTLGFGEIEIIDDDLGSSAALGARVREGFTQLLGSVALGEVGMVLSIEVARLSRTDKDWCHLLELCQVFGTLIADADHIYDLATIVHGSESPSPYAGWCVDYPEFLDRRQQGIARCGVQLFLCGNAISRSGIRISVREK